MPTEQQPTRDEHLNRLSSLRREREDALYTFARLEFAAVLDARLDGATWAEVGAALGVSAQAVQQKYHARMIPARADPEGITDEELEVLIEAELAAHRAKIGHLPNASAGGRPFLTVAR